MSVLGTNQWRFRRRILNSLEGESRPSDAKCSCPVYLLSRQMMTKHTLVDKRQNKVIDEKDPPTKLLKSRLIIGSKEPRRSAKTTKT